MAALVASFLPVLALVFALSADVAYLYGVRSAMQAAADLGALAGAQAVDLDSLAEGRLRLLEPQAEADARLWARRNLQAHPLTAPLLAVTELRAVVVQGDVRAPVRHPWSGRPVRDPTVAVMVEASVRPPWLASLVGPVGLVVRADASVAFRR